MRIGNVLFYALASFGLIVSALSQSLMAPLLLPRFNLAAEHLDG